MHTRQNALNKWLKNIVGDTPFTLTPLAGDASFRRYFRLQSGGLTRVVMDAPPDKETITSFIDVGNILTSIGVHTPAIHAVEYSQGFIVLEDLGDQLLLKALSNDNADTLYTEAINTLLRLQQCSPSHPQIANFDKFFMLQELSLFREWFLEAYLALELTAKDKLCLEKTFDWLTTEIAAQPQVFIHRDYQSRNLIVVDQNNPSDLGVIDFQDAMYGPFTYDLVSLLKDCYLQWPRAQIINWASYFYDKLPAQQGWSLTEFMRAFDFCGLQRHLKVLGIFCRLHLRDHKATYLSDLPLTFNYVNSCLESYSELEPLYQFMQEKVYLPFAEKIKA